MCACVCVCVHVCTWLVCSVCIWMCVYMISVQFVCICVCLCVLDLCVQCICICTLIPFSVWVKTCVEIRWQVLLLTFYLLWSRSLVYHSISQSRWPESFQGLSWLCTHFSTRPMGSWMHALAPDLMEVLGDRTLVLMFGQQALDPLNAPCCS